MPLKRIGQALGRLERSAGGRKASRIISAAFTVLVGSYLAWRLIGIGLARVMRDVPGNPLFYAALVLKFSAAVFFQALVFRVIWKKPLRVLFPACLTKTVLDKNLMDMSGDVYLMGWARKHVSCPAGDILRVWKDNFLLSSTASLFEAAVLLGTFFGLGLVAWPKTWLSAQWGYAALTTLAGAVLGFLIIKFRKRIFFLGRKPLAAVFGLHVSRLLVVQAVQVGIWSLGRPHVSPGLWIEFLCAQIIIANVPFLPTKNLIFFGAGLEISKRLALPSASIAALFLAETVVNQALGLLGFLAASWVLRRRRAESESAEAGPATGFVPGRDPSAEKGPGGELAEGPGDLPEGTL
jgi:hypothetical protein